MGRTVHQNPKMVKREKRPILLVFVLFILYVLALTYDASTNSGKFSKISS